MALVLKLDTSTGFIAQLLPADSIDVDIISQRTAGTDMTIGANLGTGDELQLGKLGETVRVMGDLYVDGSEVVSTDETVTGTFNANGDVNLGSGDGDEINLGGGKADTINLNANLVVGANATGTGDSFSGTAPAMTLTDSGAYFDAGYVGKSIVIAGSTTPGNDGTFTILTVPTSTSVTYSNASGVAEAFTGTWSVSGVGLVSIGSSASDYLQALWLRAVNNNGPNADAYNLNASGTNAGAYSIGINPALLTNVSPTSTDLMTALDELDAAISSATGTLQEAYQAGNTIAVTSTYGIVDLSNNTNSDTTTVLRVSKSPSSSTAGYAVQIVGGANATGTMLEVDNAGSGAALDIKDGGTSVLTVSGAGKITAAPTSGQNFKVTTAGVGTLEVDAAGGLDIDAAGASHITVAGANLTLSTTTSGDIIATAAGVLNADAASMEFDASGASGIEINAAAGPISIGNDANAQNINIGTGAAARTITVGNAASTEVEINALSVDINAGSSGFDIAGGAASKVSTSAGNLTLDSAAGELVFDDVGNSGLTLSQTGDRTLVETGSGEVFEGITSVIGALNALADVQVIGPYQAIPIENGVTVAAGDCAAQSTTAGRCTLWNGDEAANPRFIGIFITGGTGNAGGTVLAKIALPGSLVTDSGASWTAGAALFGPEGTGRPVAIGSAPNDSNDAFKRLGFAHTATSMFLDPGPTVILS